MRIRKNAKRSSLIYPQGSRPESVHVCQLNQSPWDVIPFAREPYPASSSSSLHFQTQFEAEDSFNGNGSLGDSIGAVESVASMMESEAKAIMKVEGMAIDDNDGLKIAKQFGFKSQFEEEEVEEEKEPRQEAMLKSCNNSFDSGNIPSSLTNKKAAEKNIQLTGSRRGRARAAKKGSSSSTSNPYEFYYYSGFGPLWGKRRGGGGGSDNRAAGDISKNIIEAKEFENNSSAITTQNNKTPSSSSQIENNEEFDYVDDDDDDDEDEGNGDSGKKRMRKPIKARSLKSLM